MSAFATVGCRTDSLRTTGAQRQPCCSPPATRAKTVTTATSLFQIANASIRDASNGRLAHQRRFLSGHCQQTLEVHDNMLQILSTFLIECQDGIDALVLDLIRQQVQLDG
jgi:hypothetical protein